MAKNDRVWSSAACKLCLNLLSDKLQFVEVDRCDDKLKFVGQQLKTTPTFERN